MKKSIVLSALLIAAQVSLFAAGGSETATSETKPAEPLYVAMIMKSYSGDFWKTVEMGAKAAGTELGVRVTVEAPDSETNIEQQIKMVETAVIKGAKIIAISVLDTKGLVPAIEQASAAGVKIITFNSQVASTLPLTHVATDNWAAGVLAGKTLGELLGGKGKYAVIGAVEGVKNNRDRSDGAVDYIKKNFPEMKLITIQYTDNDLNKGLAIGSDIITANPDIAGFFSNNETTTISVATVLEEKRLIGKVKHVGFDATKQTVGFLNNGVTNAIVTQVPFNMGYMTVKRALESTKGIALEKVTDTGVALVTKENVNSEKIQKIIDPLKK